MRIRVAIGLVLLLLAGVAEAHQVGISYGKYKLAGSSLAADVTFAHRDTMELVPGLDANRDGVLTGTEVEAGRALIAEAIEPLLEVRSGGKRCRGRLDHAEPVEEDGILIALRYDCDPPPALVEIELRFIDRLSAGHRQLVQVSGSGSPIERVARSGDQLLKIAGDPSAVSRQSSSSALGMFVLGIEHILSGIDHLLFLIGLLLVGGPVRSLIGVITAFTIAHSITLGLATLGVWAPSGSFVEPAIALSVAYVAIENWFVDSGKKRWRITFAFGLIHGFGFAGALRELAIPRSEIPLALLLFNLGVETGQLAVLSVILPAILWARRREGFRTAGVRAISAVIAVVAIYWFVVRVGAAIG